MPIKKKKINYRMDLTKQLEEIPVRKKSKIKREIAEYILNEIEGHTSAGLSPVTGNEYKDLSKSYAAKKKKITGSTEPDLHLKNKMISSISAEIKDNAIEFKITDVTEKKKAFNHITGDTLPRREFLPDDSKKGKFGTFNKEIVQNVKRIIKEGKNAD